MLIPNPYVGPQALRQKMRFCTVASFRTRNALVPGLSYGLSQTLENAMLDSILGVSLSITATHVQLHFAAPGATGLQNISNGDGTRQPITFGEARTGGLAITGTPPSWMNTDADEAITHVSVWADQTYLWSAPLALPRQWVSSSTLTLTTSGLILDELAE